MSGSYVDNSGRAETFNQQAAHDTGLYDPNVHDNQIVALYESEDKARMARDKLIAAGVPAHAVKVMDRGADPMAGGVDYESGNQGIWGAIKSLFMPDEDAHAYSHAIGRGHSMVVVTPTRDMDRHHVIEALESTGPVDFDAKLEEWRQAGYQGLEASASSNTGSGQTGNATVERAQATPANYAVNQTTVTDHIPADARRTSEMPSGVAGTPAGTAGTGAGSTTSTGSGTAAGVGGAVAGGLAAAGRGVANAAERAVDAVSDAVSGHDDATRHSTTGATAGTPSGTTISTTQAGRSTEDVSRPATAGTDETIKVVQEQLRVGKREVARGAVRVRSYVVERPVEEQVRLHEERVQIERRPVDRPVGEADAAAFQDRTIEAQAHAEEAVVGKEARVVEEIGVNKQATERVETVRDTVRHTEVEVEDTRGQTASTTGTSTTGTSSAGTSGSGGTGTGGTTSTATTGTTSSGTNAPRK